MIKGFKEFLMRGNVLDLAVAVVIGTAFAKVVETIVSSFVNPLVNVLGGGNVKGLSWTIINSNPKTTIDFAAIINAAIVFFLTAVVVYFVLVVPMQKIQERRKRGEEPEPEALTLDQELLTDIRDALRTRNDAPPPRA
ncbi:MAG TPA: large conductance mechanosensitive channel protein MscL [Kribbellaceae bacterium]|nr:large conductance mechanosensitive channel protein MscL [Kribbellaceae bacterium]